jgi:hypothetical protein
LECLSDASFLGKLLVLPANVRLDWKVIARYKHSSLLGLVISDEGKKFYKIDTRASFWVELTGEKTLESMTPVFLKTQVIFKMFKLRASTVKHHRLVIYGKLQRKKVL